MMKAVKRLWDKVALVPSSTVGFLEKEFTLIVRKRKYLYLSLALPLIIGLIYVFTLTGEANRLKVMVCDYDDTIVTKDALASLSDFTVNRDTSPDCADRLAEEIRNRRYLFGIIIEKGFTERLDSLQQAVLLVYYDNSEPSISSLASWKMDSALTPFKTQLLIGLGNELKSESGSAREKTQLALDLVDYANSGPTARLKTSIKEADMKLERLERIEPRFIASPIVTNNIGVHKEYGIIEVGIAPLFTVLSLFLLLMLCSTGVIYDRKIKLIERIRASNSAMFSYVSSKLIIFFALTVAQFILILILFFAFGARYDLSFILLVKALLFISLVNTLIGFLIGIISDSEGVAVLISLIITLPSLFLSGMFYPLDLMPTVIRWATKIMPLNTEVMMMKQAMLFGGQFSGYYFLVPIGLFILCLILLRRN